jgi:competence protein ComEC
MRLPLFFRTSCPPPLLLAGVACAVAYYLAPYAPHLGFALPVCGAVPFALLVLSRFFRTNKLRHAGIKTAFVGFGLLMGLCVAHRARVDARVALGQENHNAAALEGWLLDDPRALASGTGLSRLKLEHTVSLGGVRTSAFGSQTVFFSKESVAGLKDIGRLAKVRVEGGFLPSKDERPPVFWAKKTLPLSAPPSSEARRTRARLALTQAFEKQKKWGGLALALVLGSRDLLDSSLATAYRDAGLSYILALSGMHLAIISALAAFFLRKPLGKKGAAAAGIVITLAYIYLVGKSPSLERAALMYCIGAACVVFGLKGGARITLPLAFMLQLAATPLDGRSFSFILSYLALASILTLGNSINSWTAGKIPPLVGPPLSASLGAFLGTAAVTCAFFGTVRPAGLLAGLVMAPLTTVFMAGAIGFTALAVLVPLVLPAVWPYIATVVAFPMSLLYRALETIAKFTARGPAPAINSTVGLVVLALFPVALYLVLSEVSLRRRLHTSGAAHTF